MHTPPIPHLCAPIPSHPHPTCPPVLSPSSLHQTRNLLSERALLRECQDDFKFVVEYLASYQSQNEVFLLMEYVPGGDLWTHLYDPPKDKKARVADQHRLSLSQEISEYDLWPGVRRTSPLATRHHYAITRAHGP